MTRTTADAQDADPALASPTGTPTGPSWPGRVASRLHIPVRDILVCLFFVLLAGWLTHQLWPDPGGRLLDLNQEDQTLYEWFLASDARVLLGDFGLLSDRLNAPDGVNLMANTTVIALGFLLAPVTLLFGAPTTFALLVAGNLAASAIAFYLLFTRTVGAHRLAAALGGGFCGFAPGMVSQSNSHLHMTALWLIPVMIWLLVRLLHAADPENHPGGRPRWSRVLTSGAGLALAVSLQVFIGEEVLFLTAVTLIIMTISYAATRPAYTWRVLPGFLAGMLVATGIALALLGYPLWFQFAGPQGVADGLFDPSYFSADLASWPAISPLSLAGTAAAADLTTGPAEYNTFLGWPLLLITLAATVRLIRRPIVLAAAVSTMAMAALSLGPTIVVNGEPTPVPGPYALLGGLPVVDGALPMRFALAVIPLIATILVLAADTALRASRRSARIAIPATISVALLPVFPLPLPGTDRDPLPEFIAAGHWRDCVPPGGVLVPVPLATPREPWAMAWATATTASFGIPEGFFIGPYGADGRASMGTYQQPTSRLLAEVARTGAVPEITDAQRDRTSRDLARWDADCVVLVDGTPHRDRLHETVADLIGPGTRVADAWTWRVG